MTGSYPVRLGFESPREYQMMTYDQMMELTGGKPMDQQEEEALEDWAESVDATLDALQDHAYETNGHILRMQSELTKLKDAVFSVGVSIDRTKDMPQSNRGTMLTPAEHYAQFFGGTDDGQGHRGE